MSHRGADRAGPGTCGGSIYFLFSQLFGVVGREQPTSPPYLASPPWSIWVIKHLDDVSCKEAQLIVLFSIEVVQRLHLHPGCPLWEITQWEKLVSQCVFRTKKINLIRLSPDVELKKWKTAQMKTTAQKEDRTLSKEETGQHKCSTRFFKDSQSPIAAQTIVTMFVPSDTLTPFGVSTCPQLIWRIMSVVKYVIQFVINCLTRVTQPLAVVTQNNNCHHFRKIKINIMMFK